MNSIPYISRIKIGIMRSSIFASGLIVICSFTAAAQEALKPRSSPLAIASIRYKDAYLKIVYSQPQKRGREIFGGLIPFGDVWRLGANEATEITLTQDLLVNNTQLKAGTYSLFSIPGKEKWTIIFNRDLGQWGAYNYNQKMDVMRFDIPVKSIPENVVYEPFTIRIDQKTDTAEIFFLWDKTQVSFSIQFIELKP